jgi:hypothetical protein
MIVGCFGWRATIVSVMLAPACGHAQTTQVGLSSEQPMVDDLRADNSAVQRRAALTLALRGKDSHAVVDAVVAHGVPAFLALRILRQSGADQSVGYLSSDNARSGAIAALTLFDPPLVSDKSKLHAIAGNAVRDPVAAYVAELVLLACSPSPPAKERLDKLASQYVAMSSEQPEINLLWTGFRATRQRGVQLIRNRLVDVIQEVSRGAEPEDLPALIVALALSARDEKLGENDLALLGSLQKVLKDRDITVLDTSFEIVKWLGTGRKQDALDSALALLGSDGPDLRMQSACIQGFGDGILIPEKDIPPLVARAADRNAPASVRAGAIRLLGFLGSTDKRVHTLLKEILQNEEKSLREEAARAILWCVDEDGFVLRVINSQLEAESSPDVKEYLIKAQHVVKR